MTRWGECRAFLIRADRSFDLWVRRQPEWKLWLVLPVILLVVMIEWACWFPRFTAAVAATLVAVLVAVYVPLIRSGAVVFSWRGALSYLGIVSLTGYVMLYLYLSPLLFGVLLHWLHDALWPPREGKTSAERTGAASLWDREIDG